MKKSILMMGSMLTLTSSLSFADSISFDFKSPAFNGVGYSSHALTIEQLEANRRQKVKDDIQSAADKAERELKSTNSYKFKNNLESRIYAQLSKQISDSLFGEGATVSDDTWYSTQTPFGDNVSWKRGSDDRIYVVIKDSNGDTVAEFDVPVGEFAF